MKHIDINLPIELCRCFGNEIEFSTSISKTKNNQEIRNSNWQEPNFRYKLLYNNCSQKLYEKLKSFFIICRGKEKSFVFFDVNDNEIKSQILGKGDGEKTKFQIFKIYAYDNYYYERKINIVKNVKIYQNNLLINPNKYTITDGIITFLQPPENGNIISIDATFYIKARFDNDNFNVIQKTFNNVEISDISIVEVK